MMDRWQGQPAPTVLRDFYDKGDFAKHSGVEAFVATQGSAVGVVDDLDIGSVDRNAWGGGASASMPRLPSLPREMPRPVEPAVLPKPRLSATVLAVAAQAEAAAAQKAATAAAQYAKHARNIAEREIKKNKHDPKIKAIAAAALLNQPLDSSSKSKPVDSVATIKSLAPKQSQSAPSEIWVAFRGTNDKTDTIKDIKAFFRPWPYNSKVGHVHGGFLDQYSQVRESIKKNVLQLIQAGYSSLHFTGHSLGGALSELAGMDAAEYTKGTGLKTLTVMSFGAPDPGDVAWVANYDNLVKLSTRVVYETDITPCVPGQHKLVAGVTRLMNAGKSLLTGKKPVFSQRFKQVRHLLQFFRGKWRSIRWPKCKMYKQSITDHDQGLYLKALLDHPLGDADVRPLRL